MALSCRQTQRMLSLYLDHSLPAAKAGAVEEHLGICPICRAELAGWERIAAALAGAPVPALPGDFTSRVMGRIAAAERRAGAETRRGLLGMWARTAVHLGSLPGLIRVAAAMAAVAVLLYGSWNFTARYLANSAGPAVAHKATEETLPQQPVGEEKQELVINAPPAGEDNTPVPVEQVQKRAAALPKAAANGGVNRKEPTSPEPAKPETQGTAPSYQLARQDVPAPVPYRPRAFLNKERLITSTFLRVQVANLDQAETAARAFGREMGAKVEELARGQAGGRAQLGLKFTVDTNQANMLLVRLTGLGRVLDRSSETRDVTADFATNLKLYHYWIGLRNTLTNPAEVEAIDREIARVEKQLSTWEEEAAKQVIVLWLEEE